MIPVMIESPYAGDRETNLTYLRRAMRDCLLRGEAPFASHALYTQPGVLRDELPEERRHGIQAGFAFRAVTRKTVVYDDYGESGGMALGIANAKQNGHVIEFRLIGTNDAPLPEYVHVEVTSQLEMALNSEPGKGGPG